jgi:predicted deacylase
MSKETIKIGTVEVGRGEFSTGVIPLFRLASGMEVSVPLQVWHGLIDGPVLCLIAGQHGNEFRPISVFGEMIKRLDPRKMRGTVVAVPMANPFAVASCSRNTWLDGLNGNDGNLNRVWPGKKAGWTTEQMAAKLSETLLPIADVLIDFHNGTHTLSIYYSYITAADGSLGDQIAEYSKAFGLEIMIRRPAIGGSLTGYAVSRGIVAWAVELGEFYGFADDQDFCPRRYPEVGCTGVMNVLSAMGMIDRSLVLPKRRVILESALVGIGPETGGLLVSEVGVKDIGHVVDQGHVLGRIMDPVTFEEEMVLTAPLNKNLIVAVTETRPLLPINPGAGDWGYYVADYEKAVWEERAG